MIHRPEVYKIYEDDHHNDMHGIAEIIIAKHRNGGVGDVRLAFHNTFARFCDVEKNTGGEGGMIMSSRMNEDQQAQTIANAMPPEDPLAGPVGDSPF